MLQGIFREGSAPTALLDAGLARIDNLLRRLAELQACNHICNHICNHRRLAELQAADGEAVRAGLRVATSLANCEPDECSSRPELRHALDRLAGAEPHISYASRSRLNSDLGEFDL